jgi:hypothetical protein
VNPRRSLANLEIDLMNFLLFILQVSGQIASTCGFDAFALIVVRFPVV